MATAAAPRGKARGLTQRLTGKVGPLPVWAWALLILTVGYLVYRLTGQSTATAPAASDTSSTADGPASTSSGDTGSPPSSGQGGAADNVNSDLLSQLAGLGSSVDQLTGLIQSTPAFYSGGGDAGSGSAIPNDGYPAPAAAAPIAAAVTVRRPTAAPPAPARVRYYTYQPGKAPKNRKGDEAPARGPAGTTLRFARGKGYYYA